MTAVIRLHNKPNITIQCKELSVRDGVRMLVEGEYCQFLVVITEKELFHPVVDVEVM